MASECFALLWKVFASQTSEQLDAAHFLPRPHVFRNVQLHGFNDVPLHSACLVTVLPLSVPQISQVASAPPRPPPDDALCPPNLGGSTFTSSGSLDKRWCSACARHTQSPHSGTFVFRPEPPPRPTRPRAAAGLATESRTGPRDRRCSRWRQ